MTRTLEAKETAHKGAGDRLIGVVNHFPDATHGEEKYVRLMSRLLGR